MKAAHRALAAFVPVIVLALLSACQPRGETPSNTPPPTHSKASNMQEQIVIKLGEQGSDYLKRYPTLIGSHQSLPGVVQDYNIYWEQGALGSVRIDHGEHSISIDHVGGLQTSQDLKDLPEEGLSEFFMMAGITGAAGIDHDEARLKTYAILQRIAAAGWKIVTPRSSPRLSGQARLDYVLNVSSLIDMDVSPVPTLDEWMRLDDLTTWMFYADGLFLAVDFRRSPERLNTDKVGVYLLGIKVKTAVEFFRGYAPPEKRMQWKEILQGALEMVAQMRAKEEAEFKANGIVIDESYQDPPIPKLE